MGRERSLGLDQALTAVQDPAADEVHTGGGDRAAEPHAKFRGKRFTSRGGDSLRHRFVEDCADKTAMNDTPETLEFP